MKCIPFVFLLALAFASCRTSKELPYFRDLPDTARLTHIPSDKYQPLELEANDEVQVLISSSSPEASQFFNQIALAPNPIPGSNTNTYSASNIYRVSATGNITLPVLGDIPATGLTTDSLKKSIKGRLASYLKDPTVSVALTNFKVTVIGEVNKPIVVPVNGETINVLEAIGASGDMTVYGVRRNVRVLRKNPDGSTDIANLDFNKSDIIKDPYFQLKQNDIVYVKPMKSKGVLATRSTTWIPIISGLVSVVAIILTRTN